VVVGNLLDRVAGGLSRKNFSVSSFEILDKRDVKVAILSFNPLEIPDISPFCSDANSERFSVIRFR
jgi:hypothetical protein